LPAKLVSRPGVVACAIVYGALLVFLRGRPALGDDQGIFISLAARLVHGDHLYTDVWDNKEPLFYYSNALAFAIGGWRAPAALDALWLAIAAVSIAALVRFVGGSRLAAASAFAVYPLLLTGETYYSNDSMFAALALTPAVGALAVRQRWFSAGALLGVALAFKINLGLMLLAAPAVLLFFGPPQRSVRNAVLKAAAGAGAALTAVGIVLAVQGELGAYIDTIRQNVSYASDVLVYSNRPTGILGHLRLVVGATAHVWLVMALFCAGAAVAGWMVWRSFRHARSQPDATLAALFLAASAAALVTLSLTAAFDHHLQMLAYPEVLFVTFFVVVASSAIDRPTVRWAAVAALVAFGIWSFGGADRLSEQGLPISQWWADVRSPPADALEAAASKPPFADAERITYAHLGQNDEEGHAAFIDDRFDLACRKFHQYDWSSYLPSVLECIEQRQPDLILVTWRFAPRADAPERWNDFALRGSAMLARDYERAVLRRAPPGKVEVWKRRAGDE
jgi:hypothetical protein